MLYRYLKFDKKRIAAFAATVLFILILQYIVCGSIVSRQNVTTKAGNDDSSVIGIIDDEEIIRQKFKFDRKVVLSQFVLYFGAFEREDVGDVLQIQMTDADNYIVYETEIPVDKIKPNKTYAVNMDHTVTIPKGVVCCIRITCSSEGVPYAIIPTLNTTNRTDPNTYMSTLKMQTRKKSLNISYSYSYRQIYPLIALVSEFALIFVICFERVTDYAPMFRKRRKKMLARMEKERLLHEEAQEKRRAAGKAVEGQKKGGRYDEKKKRRLFRHFSLTGIVRYCLSEPKVEAWIRRAIVFINPLALFVMLEMMNGNIAHMYPNVWIFTWILLLAFEFIFYAVFGNMNIAMAVMDLILFPFGLANLFIMNVRGTPLLPADIFGLATAKEVAATYSIKFTPAEFIIIPAFIIWIMLIVRFYKKSKRAKEKRDVLGAVRAALKRCAPAVAACAAILIMHATPLLTAAGIEDNVWNKAASCRSNGFYMNFFINMRYLKVKEPSGYSVEKVARQIKDFKDCPPIEYGEADGGEILTNCDFGPCESLGEKKPNIILIMNESLADFSLVGDVNYNADPLEFIHGLKDDAIKGLDYVSVFGAGTSNSEFEAMTGNTMEFFPSGCNVYQQFMHDETYSISSYLKSLGYSCDAVHPSSGSNWNRVNTYKSMKFDRFITIDDFKDPEYVRYISDKESYKKVIELYEKRDKSKPMFVFDMTIQNHGGYLTNTNWEEPVYVKDSYYDEAKEFLSATKVSDDAFKYLIDYFKNEDEPTLICMFGDHFPSIEEEFYEDLLKKPQEEWELEDIQKRYATPFVIWANYDIKEGENVSIGNNLIENMVLKAAGIELPLYNKYTEMVSKTIPVMNVNGYMNADGEWRHYGRDETEEEKKLLSGYELLQYAYYSDGDKEKMSALFEMD